MRSFAVLVCFCAFTWAAPNGLAQTVTLTPATPISMPGVTDSNSPTFWRDGMFHIINSTAQPRITAVFDPTNFDDGEVIPVSVDTQDHFPMWIESVWQDEDGSLFAWYHHEQLGVCKDSTLTMPAIGALVSFDGGYNYIDLGIVLSSGQPADCSAKNGFFAGGHGDFSVVLDPERKFFYFMFDNYGGPAESQGVATARMAFEDRWNPVGTVWKFREGEWTQPGIGGAVTPVFQAAVPWNLSNTDAYWGPSLHWNTSLQSFVALMNHACCGPKWPQEGIYITFNPDPSNPSGWTMPARLLSAKEIGYSPGYYPQVIGNGFDETDSLAGRSARLYIKGFSKWEISFEP